MNIESSINKLISPIEKHANLVGAGLLVLSPYRIQQIQENISSIASGQIHMPNISNFIQNAINNPDTHYKDAAMVAIAGYFAKDMTSNSAIKAAATAAQKAAVAYIGTGLVSDLGYYMTHSNLGCDKDGFVMPPNGGVVAVSTQSPSNYMARRLC